MAIDKGDVVPALVPSGLGNAVAKVRGVLSVINRVVDKSSPGRGCVVLQRLHGSVECVAVKTRLLDLRAMLDTEVLRVRFAVGHPGVSERRLPLRVVGVHDQAKRKLLDMG